MGREGAVRIGGSRPLSGRISVPGSKSVSNRALVCAALAEGESVISGGLVGDDADSMVTGLRTLGASILEHATGDSLIWEVAGTGGRLTESPVTLDAALAGTTFRFLVAVSSLAAGEVTVTGRGPLLARPIGPLLDVLRRLGARVEAERGPDGAERGPVRLLGRSGRLGGVVAVDASRSSQFVTALLLVAPYFDDGLVLEPLGLQATGFVDLTLELMGEFGVTVGSLDAGYAVAGGLSYRGRPFAVPPDASAAMHLFTLAMATGGEVSVADLARAGRQPDYAFLEVLERFGATWAVSDEGDVSVRAPSLLSPVDLDLSAMPDQLPNAAVLAALADGTSRISGVGITRFHESDRMSAVAAELGKVGIATEEGEDELLVRGGAPRGGATFSSHGDHRLAMALTALAARTGGCAMTEADAVGKTYRHFWRDAASLGLEVSPA